MANQNSAAYLTAAKAHPLEIREAPLTQPGPNQILIRNHAIAINPIDYKLQKLAFIPLNYPTILGEDVAGEIIAVGEAIKRFNVGDRVLGCAAGFTTKKDTDKAFQNLTILEESMSTRIPETMTLEAAVVLPLGLATAVAGLFNQDSLALPLPTWLQPTDAGMTLLVWGGASSVGSNAIQLAVAAGCRVISTASSKNIVYVEGLGAQQVLDYHSPSIVDDVIAATDGHEVGGVYDAIGGVAVVKPVFEILQQVKGRKFVASVASPQMEVPDGIIFKHLQALSITFNGVGEAVFGAFLTEALEAGTYVSAPQPIVVGKGLEKIQDAIDLMGKGVSASKIVVQL